MLCRFLRRSRSRITLRKRLVISDLQHFNDGASTRSDTMNTSTRASAGTDETHSIAGDGASQESAGPDSTRRTLYRLNYARGPVAVGMSINAVELVTSGPIGFAFRLPVGGLAGYWPGRGMRLENHMCWIWWAAAGLYSSIPAQNSFLWEL